MERIARPQHSPCKFHKRAGLRDMSNRLFEAESALRYLEHQVEQLTLHIEGLAAHPQEASRARLILEKLQRDLASQRTCCEWLAKAGHRQAATKTG
jgi:hypothetical protein